MVQCQPTFKVDLHRFLRIRYGNRIRANIPVIKTERIIRSTQMMTMSLKLTGISVAIRQGTKLARKMIEVTGMTAIM